MNTDEKMAEALAEVKLATREAHEVLKDLRKVRKEADDALSTNVVALVKGYVDMALDRLIPGAVKAVNTVLHEKVEEETVKVNKEFTRTLIKMRDALADREKDMDREMEQFGELHDKISLRYKEVFDAFEGINSRLVLLEGNARRK